MKWLTAVPFLFLFFTVNLVTVEPAWAQAEGASDSELPAAIKALRGEIAALQGELASYVAGLQGGDKARRGKGFEAYRRQFETLGGRISSCRERLQYFSRAGVAALPHHAHLFASTSPPGRPMPIAKQDFDALASNFSSSPRPETLQIAEVRVTDGRLTRHLARTAPEPAPVKPEQSIGRDIP
ncbi:hypothetical protein [Chloracidobacterium aggregatum]|uniref:Uncharacterized protein n=1 Tax=Chloracidobacterium sp. N TaxID=2821540 RepID=A0ABX8B317_9BACT|nr:hypothetical protein [Chloracidobacterium aggregatum]QUV95015.1 hypothetical protein J8C05_13380 [Chloracidobacterium sp. N]